MIYQFSVISIEICSLIIWKRAETVISNKLQKYAKTLVATSATRYSDYKIKNTKKLYIITYNMAIKTSVVEKILTTG